MTADHLLDLHGDVLAAMRRGPKPFAKLAFALADDEAPDDTPWNASASAS